MLADQVEFTTRASSEVPLTSNVHKGYQMEFTSRASSDVPLTQKVHKIYQMEFTARASSDVPLTPECLQKVSGGLHFPREK